MRSEVVTRDLTWLMYIVCPSKAAAVQFVDGKILYSNAEQRICSADTLSLGDTLYFKAEQRIRSADALFLC